MLIMPVIIIIIVVIIVVIYFKVINPPKPQSEALWTPSILATCWWKAWLGSRVADLYCRARLRYLRWSDGNGICGIKSTSLTVWQPIVCSAQRTFPALSYTHKRSFSPTHIPETHLSFVFPSVLISSLVFSLAGLPWDREESSVRTFCFYAIVIQA